MRSLTHVSVSDEIYDELERMARKDKMGFSDKVEEILSKATNRPTFNEIQINRLKFQEQKAKK